MRHSSARRLPSALFAALLLVLAGCSSDEQATPEPDPVPIANLNTAAMEVPRIEFCTLVPSSAVREALGGKPGPGTAYGNGDEETLPGVGTEVVHELGCSWTRTSGQTARAWVFARPVDAAFARRVVEVASGTPGCRIETEPSFGQPTMTQTCRRQGGEERVRHAGLFGQTWLTCEVSAPNGTGSDSGVGERADRWCVEVATTLNTAR